MISKSGVGLLIYKQGIVEKESLSPASETVAKGIYDATTLSTVDTDLAAANIKSAVTIFGKEGTFAGGPVVYDAQNCDVDSQVGSGPITVRFEEPVMDPGSDVTILTTTIACAQTTALQAAYFVAGKASNVNSLKLQMYIDGVAQGETGYVGNTAWVQNYDIGHEAVSSGSRTAYLNCHNYGGAVTLMSFSGIIFACCGKV